VSLYVSVLDGACETRTEAIAVNALDGYILVVRVYDARKELLSNKEHTCYHDSVVV
jgi:hypothetical protein